MSTVKELAVEVAQLKVQLHTLMSKIGDDLRVGMQPIIEQYKHDMAQLVEELKADLAATAPKATSKAKAAYAPKVPQSVLDAQAAHAAAYAAAMAKLKAHGKGCVRGTKYFDENGVEA